MTERIAWDQSTMTHEPQVLGPAAHLWTRTSLTPTTWTSPFSTTDSRFNCLSWIEGLGFCGIGEAKDFLAGGKNIALQGGSVAAEPTRGPTLGWSYPRDGLHARGSGTAARRRRRSAAEGAEVAVVSSGGLTPAGAILLRTRLRRRCEGPRPHGLDGTNRFALRRRLLHRARRRPRYPGQSRASGADGRRLGGHQGRGPTPGCRGHRARTLSSSTTSSSRSIARRTAPSSSTGCGTTPTSSSRVRSRLSTIRSDTGSGNPLPRPSPSRSAFPEARCCSPAVRGSRMRPSSSSRPRWDPRSTGSVSNPFLDQAFRTLSYRIHVTINDDGTWSYEEEGVLADPRSRGARASHRPQHLDPQDPAPTGATIPTSARQSAYKG